MNRLDITLELLTPAFWSGADQKEVELRSQSVKGILRWWWRAVVGDHRQELESLRDEEAQLFGSAESKLRSPLCLQISPVDSANVKDYGGYPWKSGKMVQSGTYSIDAIEYLAYGPVATVGRKEKDQSGRALDPKFNDAKGKAKAGLVLKRPAFDVGSGFVLSLQWREDSIEKMALGKLFSAVAAWIAFGGIGSRARKGWGAVDLVEISGEPQQLETCAKEEIWRAKENLLKNPGKLNLISIPKWPTVEFRQLCHRTHSSQDWRDVLGKLGDEYTKLKRKIPKQYRWIFGSASPRRASSVFVTVKRDQNRQLVGSMWAFPSWRSWADDGSAAWQALAKICAPPSR
jgi:CRISPR-associated protein Cmr1